MELYILRHGDAEFKAPSGRDPDRRLTAEGIARVRRQMQRAAGRGISPEAIFSSPYVRAMETAKIAAELLGYEAPILTSPELTPDASPGEIWTEVRGFSQQVLLVSHEPLASGTVAWMTGVAEVSPFSTAGLARLDIEIAAPVPRAQLRWILEP